MKLIRFLFRHSSSASVLLAISAGLLSGLANTGLLALVNLKITSEGELGGKLLWAFVGLLLLAPVARILSSYLLIRWSQRAVYRLRLKLTRKILASPLRQLEALGNHRLMASITQDLSTLANVMAQLPLLSMHSAIVLGALVYLGWLSWQLLLLLLATMVVGIVTYQVPALVAVRQQEISREKTDTIFNHYRSVVHGLKELKLHRLRREAFLARLDADSGALQKMNVKASTIFSAAAGWGEMLIFMVVGFMLFGAVGLIDGLSEEVVVGYIVVVLYLMNPLAIILELFPDMSRAEVALKKTESLGLSLDDEGGAGDDVPAPILPDTGFQRLRFDGMIYRYGDATGDGFTLGPIDFTVRQGEILFIIGGNGSGKTTLAKLLVGLYEPDAGQIRIDERVVGKENRDSFRQLFSAVFSDFFLFDSLLGLDEFEVDERAREFLAALQLDDKVKVEDGLLSTTDLSQGQRKRLALLTAFLEDRPIYVFDEWAADQDPKFKRVFYYEILEELRNRGKTVIVITHDDRYFDAADRIVKLDSGEVAEESLADDGKGDGKSAVHVSDLYAERVPSVVP